jgi:3-vinyl bacteriochlorophyllide hydratase
MFKEFTPEQIERRKNTKLTSAMMSLAIIQLIAYVAGFYLVIRYLVAGDMYLAATISVWVKIALMWAITIVGMLWEKDVCGQYFMHKDFFWEDFGNLVAIITHNAYFAALALDFSEREIMYVMLFAYVTYLFNLGQWIVVGMRSYKQRKLIQAKSQKAA